MKAQIVSFHCILKDKMGNVISSTFNQDVITQSNVGGPVLRGFVKGLKDLKKGEKRKISVPANQAYGFYDPDLVIQVPRSSLFQGQSIALGHQLYAQSKNGETKLFHVTEVSSETVTLDANHPLAGQDLVFFIETTEVRDATSEEISESRVESSTRLLH